MEIENKGQDLNFKDKIGVPLKIGDRVIFASNSQGDDYLYTGVVISRSKKWRNAILILKDGGRLNQRSPSQVISIEEMMKQTPENFI